MISFIVKEMMLVRYSVVHIGSVAVKISATGAFHTIMPISHILIQAYKADLITAAPSHLASCATISQSPSQFTTYSPSVSMS
jgi:hypothetical protein